MRQIRLIFNCLSIQLVKSSFLQDPGQVYIGKTINMGRFLADLGSILGGSGDHLGMIWACSGGLPGLFQLGKRNLYKCSKNRFFGDRWGVCSFLRRIRPSGSGAKINFDKNFGPGLAGPDRGVVVTREFGIGSRQPLHVVTDLPFYAFFNKQPSSTAGSRVRRPGNLE